MTLQELVVEARDDLERAGITSPTAILDAELLARHALGWDRAKWLTARSSLADDRFREQYAMLIARRAAREPVAYIRGIQEFWGREFGVTPEVLIPRWETELTIEVSIPFLRDRPESLVVDLGTGSGCIAITLALEHPTARIYATDLSIGALEVARKNAERLGASRIQFVHGAYLASAPRPIDLLVTNPPYVAGKDRAALSPEVKDHEPAGALFGGDDGLDEVRAILRQSREALAPGGRLIMEIGYGQDDRVETEMDAVPELALEDIRADLQGIRRVAVIRRITASE